MELHAVDKVSPREFVLQSRGCCEAPRDAQTRGHQCASVVIINAQAPGSAIRGYETHVWETLRV